MKYSKCNFLLATTVSCMLLIAGMATAAPVAPRTEGAGISGASGVSKAAVKAPNTKACTSTMGHTGNPP